MKRMTKLLSLVLSALMIVSMLTVTLGAEESEEKTYQVARKIATVDQNLNNFSASEYGFAIDNTIYGPDGKIVRAFPGDIENGDLCGFSGRYAELFCIEDDELIIYLLDVLTGKEICKVDASDLIRYPDSNTAVIGGNIYVDGELAAELPCDLLTTVGGGMYIVISEDDRKAESGIDYNVPHSIYDITEDNTFTVAAGSVPGTFEYGYENGVYVRSDEKYYIGKKNGEPVNDVVYDSLMMIGTVSELVGLYGNGSFIAMNMDEESETIEMLLLSNSGELIASLEVSENSMEIPVVVTDKWIITIDLGAIFGDSVVAAPIGIYTSEFDLVGKYVDFTLFGDDAFVAINSENGYDILYTDGSIVKGECAGIAPVLDGKYVIIEDFDGSRKVYAAENAVIGDYICDFSGDCDSLMVSPLADDVVIASKNGKDAIMTYDGRILVPFTDGYASLNEFINGNILVTVDYMGDDAEEWYTDIYLITYEKTPFTDVPDGEWYTEYIKYAYESGLFVGNPDGTFCPDDEMTRAQLVTVLWRLSGEPEAKTSGVFSDVPAGEWYSEPILWAAENGIVLGTGAGMFSPEDNITREELAVILYRYTKGAGGDVSAKGDIDGFVDGGDISDWAVEALEWATGEGLIKGSPTEGGFAVKPQDNATRAEVATILKRAFA